MTLATDFKIIQPTNPEEVFRFGRELLEATKGVWMHRTVPIASRYIPDRIMPAQYANQTGQGFASILEVSYAIDGPLTDTGWDEASGDEYPKVGSEHCVKIRLDTNYGYEENGASCSDLHAWLVQEFAGFCDERSLSYRWQNEFTGEEFTDLSGLASFGRPDVGRLRLTPELPYYPLPDLRKIECNI